jgi:serine phosphatase RsbU (regulator of sigma subunit)/tetratricopeptide (TPR) repeat protein
MKNLQLLIVFNYLIIAVYGQNHTTYDSLMNRLSVEKSDTGKVILLYKIAYELQFTNMEQSLSYATKALESAEKIKFEKGIGNSFIQLGNIEQIKSNNSQAEEYNLKALNILLKINDFPGVAICYNNLGIIAHNTNNYASAIDYYFKSLKINRKIGRKSGEATSLYCIGTVYENQSKYDSALIYYLKARAISESISDSRLMAYGNTSLANVYFEMENYGKSLEYNEEAVRLYEKTGNYYGLVKVYLSLGQTAGRLDSINQAIWFYRQAMKTAGRIESPNDMATAFFSMAQLFEEQNLADSAYVNYTKSYNIYVRTENNENTALSLICLARIQNGWKNHSEARKLLDKAMVIANRIQAPSVNMSVYKEMSSTLSYLNDFQKAFFFLDKYSSLKDSVMSVEKQKQILELQTQYETEKKEKENVILRKDQQILQTTRNSLIIGALLLFVIAVVILRSLIVKKRDNKLLRRQKLEIERQKEIVEIQKTSITDSIHYAKRIQSAMLPPEELLKHNLYDYFLLYLPRDIVSGDFLWLRQLNENRVMICVADCTGHGVPGAFMSMLGMSLLNDITNLNKDEILSHEFTPSDILNELRERIKSSLRQTGKEGEARDGMDLSFCIIEKDAGLVRYSGANNSIYIVSSEILTEIKATRNPIGIYLNEVTFTDHQINITTGTVLYMFSDGYSDQIGSEGGKFLSKNFKHLLTEVSHLPMTDIRETLYKTHLDWRKAEEQVDDILVVGIRL